jgi:hypothetical protein
MRTDETQTIQVPKTIMVPQTVYETQTIQVPKTVMVAQTGVPQFPRTVTEQQKMVTSYAVQTIQEPIQVMVPQTQTVNTIQTINKVVHSVRMENPEENPDWSISLSSFHRMTVFILLLFIVPIFLLLLFGRPERFRTATRDNEDSEQSQPHGQPSCSSRQMRRHSALGVLLVVILMSLQAGSTSDYACKSDAHCKYSGCNNGKC